jgi:hypothetical protein
MDTHPEAEMLLVLVCAGMIIHMPPCSRGMSFVNYTGSCSFSTIKNRKSFTFRPLAQNVSRSTFSRRMGPRFDERAFVPFRQLTGRLNQAKPVVLSANCASRIRPYCRPGETREDISIAGVWG